MFKLVAMEDIVQVPPRMFGYPRLKALEHAINKRFSDKVIPGIGLGIAFWDWIAVGEDSLQIQNGDSHTTCSFRIVVFAPFEGEALFGRISGACKSGLFVELGFFDAIVVPKDRLPQPSELDEDEQVWIWKPNFEGEEQKFYMDVSNEYVFRVRETIYDDQANLPPTEREKEDRNPMSLVGALYDDVVQDNQGLGDPLWWYEEEQDGEGDGEHEEGDEEHEEESGGDYDNNEDHGENGEGSGFPDAPGDGDKEMADWDGSNNQDDEPKALPTAITGMELDAP